MALDALAESIHRKVSWVLDADIRSFFDTIDHGWMQKFIEHRIGDRRLVHLVMKMLKAGVMESGELREVATGTPQGGIISPLLANIYLHYALDLWVQSWRKTHARGEVYIVRYADDFVMGFQRGDDAEAMRKALADRLASFGLELHPDKTRLIQFGRFAREREASVGRRPATFDFLGFTHIAAEKLAGGFLLKRRTSRKKRKAKLAAVRAELRKRRHAAPARVRDWLRAHLVGHYNYYGVPTNMRAMRSYKRAIETAWIRQLQLRSQRARRSWVQWRAFLERHALPQPRIIHEWPTLRHAAR